MTECATKRVNELTPGDVFTYMGLWREVVKIEKGRLHHRTHFVNNDTGYSHDSFGANSQQKVEYHFNKNTNEPKTINR